jgi:hypothetical protein
LTLAILAFSDPAITAMQMHYCPTTGPVAVMGAARM